MPALTDPELLAAIQEIKAVDHHSHALPARRPEGTEVERPDPLGKPPFPYPVRLRVTNPEYVEAWRALYGYEHEDITDDHARKALKTKLELVRQKGVDYPPWVLDRAGIEIMLVNMPSLGPGQTAPRFLWVTHADGLLSPFAGEQGGLQVMGKKISPDETPGTLDEYLNKPGAALPGRAPAQLGRDDLDGLVLLG